MQGDHFLLVLYFEYCVVTFICLHSLLKVLSDRTRGDKSEVSVH